MAWYSPLLGSDTLVRSHQCPGHPSLSTHRDCCSDPSRCILFCPLGTLGVFGTPKFPFICLSIVRELGWLEQRRYLMVYWTAHFDLRNGR